MLCKDSESTPNILLTGLTGYLWNKFSTYKAFVESDLVWSFPCNWQDLVLVQFNNSNMVIIWEFYLIGACLISEQKLLSWFEILEVFIPRINTVKDTRIRKIMEITFSSKNFPCQFFLSKAVKNNLISKLLNALYFLCYSLRSDGPYLDAICIYK